MTLEPNWVDWVMVVLVLLSLVVGLVRGFVREAIALGGWVLAVVLVIHFAVDVGAALPFEVPWPALKVLLGGALIVVGCVFVAALVGWIVRRLLVAVRLSAADRVLGGVFGLLRGVVVVLLVVVFAGATPLAQGGSWRGSLALGLAEAAVRGLSPWLPAPLAARGGARQ